MWALNGFFWTTKSNTPVQASYDLSFCREISNEMKISAKYLHRVYKQKSLYMIHISLNSECSLIQWSIYFGSWMTMMMQLFFYIFESVKFSNHCCKLGTCGQLRSLKLRSLLKLWLWIFESLRNTMTQQHFILYNYTHFPPFQEWSLLLEKIWKIQSIFSTTFFFGFA